MFAHRRAAFRAAVVVNVMWQLLLFLLLPPLPKLTSLLFLLCFRVFRVLPCVVAVCRMLCIAVAAAPRSHSPQPSKEWPQEQLVK